MQTLHGTSPSGSSLRGEPSKETVAETSPWELSRLCVDLNRSEELPVAHRLITAPTDLNGFELKKFKREVKF